MLGAKARAAEYHAAKAASARQQASREADEHKLPPKPAPVSLSSFTRTAAYNRNKGQKNYKPLILSEKEDRSASSVELETEHTKSPSTPEFSGPRAASLPPPRKLQNKSAEIDHNIQTPFRYKNPPSVVPFVPRNILQEDAYQYMTHRHIPFAYMSYAHPQPILNQPMPAPQFGWYYPSYLDDYDHLYDQAGMSSLDPFDERPHPTLQHNNSNDFDAEVKKEFFEVARNVHEVRPYVLPESASEKESSPSRRDMREPGLHIFGPDDMTPTKIEVKDRIRREFFAKQALTSPTRPTVVSGKHVSTPEMREAKDKEKSVNSIQSLAQFTKDSNETAPFPEFEDYAKAAPYHHGTEADWPYLGRSADSYKTTTDGLTHKSIRKASSESTAEERKELKQMLLDSLLQESETTIRPPPGLEHVSMEHPNLSGEQPQQVTNIKFPLVDVRSKEWLEVRPVTVAERQRMRDVMRTVAVSSMSDKNGNSAAKAVGIERQDLRKWLEDSTNAQTIRRARVNELAEEMQKKWEHGGAFRYSTMTKDEASVHAGTVKAVTSILSTLNSHSGDSNGSRSLGSRPYCQPPEYAIARGVGLKGKTVTSLFENDGDVSVTAPPRLARDPRFRPQLEGMKVRADEDRVPRLPVYAAIRRPCEAKLRSF